MERFSINYTYGNPVPSCFGDETEGQTTKIDLLYGEDEICTIAVKFRSRKRLAG